MSDIVLIEDKANRIGKHDVKNAYWQKQGIEVLRYPLPIADYVLANDKLFDMLARKKIRGVDPHKMDFIGTYDVCCDSKNSIEELAMDICGGKKSHDRFRDELILAQNNGIKLYIVVENKGGRIGKSSVFNPTITKLEDLSKWRNPRSFIFKGGKQAYPNAVRGVTLMKACITIERKYSCRFVFTEPNNSGKIILDILRGEFDG